MNNTVASEMGAKPFPIVGFNHVRGVVDEPIRTIRRPGPSMFSDGTHFKPSLGKRIMEGVWTDGYGFGFNLQSDSVESYLAGIDQLRQEFESANVKLTATLRRGISPELE